MSKRASSGGEYSPRDGTVQENLVSYCIASRLHPLCVARIFGPQKGIQTIARFS